VWQIEKVTLVTSVALAERITAHKTPFNSGDLSGVFFFYWWPYGFSRSKEES